MSFSSISVVIAWRDRNELASALPSVIQEVDDVGGTIVIVNYGGAFSLLEPQVEQYGSAITILEVRDKLYFNKAAAHNIGVGITNTPFLFFCDCDIILSKGTLAGLLMILQDDPTRFVGLERVRETKPNSRRAKHLTRFGYELKLRTADGREATIIDHEEDSRDGTRHAPGLLVVRRDHFMTVNGYNSRLDGWGWEDQDMICRLTLGAGLHRRTYGQALHVSHDDEDRVKAYPYSDRWESRDRMFRRALSAYDEGNFSGTFDSDFSDYTAALNVHSLE